jgi:ATP-dependent helicase/nuclease subunit A
MTANPQTLAADPRASAFVTANAGSGKTTTLLLLARAEPQTILCVTYTKAAAAEMQRRLFEQLGHWSVLEDDLLHEELTKLDASTEDLSRARALFARALETPGGLKIQTIHAFCEKLLRRFPLEADVSPGFQVMEDALSNQIAAEARADVARVALNRPGPLANAYARLSVALAYDDFQAMFRAFEDRRAALAAYVERCGGLAEAITDVWTRCGFDAPVTAEAIEQAAVADDVLDAELWRGAARTLAATGKPGDLKCSQAVGAIAAAAFLGEARFADALAALFTEKGAGTPATWVARGAAFKGREDLRGRLLAEQDRLEAARERARSARVAEDTQLALILAQAYVAAYEAA